MKQKVIIALGILLFGIAIWVLFGLGFLAHAIVLYKVNSPAFTNQETVKKYFFASDKSDRLHAGTLASINLFGKNNIWIWSNYSPQIFSVNEDTIYSYYDICVAYRDAGDGNMSIGDDCRQTTFDLQKWSNLASSGNYVQITTVGFEGENNGKLIKEISAYSHPLFLTINYGNICATK